MSNKLLTKQCRAKINLAIDVVGRRENGYHNVRMIMAQVQICDTVRVALRSDGRIILRGENMPLDETNLAYRAAKAFFDSTNTAPGCEIYIEKRIPMGAGLAGGSTDAAGVINALDELCGTNLSLDQKMQIGGRLGADVPFCIMGGCALAEGIGDELTPLGDLPEMYYLIAKPEQSVSTKWVYEHLDFTQKPKGMNVDALAQAVRCSDKHGIYANMGNVLENSAVLICPDVEVYKADILAFGAEASIMSGSGSAVFGIFDSKTKAEQARQMFKGVHPAAQIWVCDSMGI